MWPLIESTVIPTIQFLIDKLVELWDKNKSWLEPALKMLAIVLGVVIVGAIMVLLGFLYAIISVMGMVYDKVRWVIGVWQEFKSNLQEVAGNAKDAISGFKDRAIEVFNDVKNKIVGVIEKVDWLKDAIVGASKALGDIGMKAIGAIAGKNAGGTPYWQGGPTIVGENGPEMVNLPRGSKVMTAGNTENVSNFGGVTINISGAGDPRAVAYEVKKLLARENLTANLGLNPSLS